ncbi:MAG: two-component regulator propeller domain-containing protein [Bacteroidota bacterium]
MFVVIAILIITSSVVAQQPLGLSTAKRVTQYKLESWQEEQGLKHNSIIALSQSADGYLWLATYSELYRFDGTTFKSYKQSLGNAQPRSLFQDSQGRMWIGTIGGLFFYSNGVFTKSILDSSFQIKTITAIRELRDGTILFGSQSGIFSYNGIKFQNRSMEYDVAGIAVWSMIETSGGEIWVGTDRGARRKTSSFVEQIDTTSGYLKHNIVRSIIEDRFGNIWIGTGGGGITRYRNGAFSTFTTNDGLPSNVIRILFEDRNGSVWIGSSGGGLSRYLNGRFETLSSTDGLTTDVVWALCQDREGSLWIGTGGGGLNRLRDSRFTALTKKEGIGNNFLWTVYEDNRGVQWIGTNGGGVTVWENGTAKSYTVGSTPLSNIVRTVVDDGKGKVWVGTADGVYFSPSSPPHSFKRYTTITAKTILVITQTSDKTLWFGTLEGGAFALNHNTLKHYTVSTGLSNNTVRTVTEHPDGSIWLGTNAGISILTSPKQRNEWKAFPFNSELSQEEIRDIYIDKDSVVWIGTDRGGLRRYHHNSFKQYSEKEGYDAVAVHEIQEDDLGFLWLTCNKGIFRVRREDLNAIARGEKTRTDFTLFGIIDGMGSSECNGGNQPAGWKMRNGTIWFPTMKGVTIISPQKLPTNTIVPPVYIEGISVDGKPVQINNETAELSAGSNRVTINFTALSLLAPELVRFKYMLDGYDQDWIDGGNSRTVSYTNIAPGNYRFRVIGSNNDGVWNNNGAAITVIQMPHFYETAWFGVSTMLLLTGLIFSAYRVRINVLKEREIELKQLVAERTQNLQVEKERAEQANQFKSDLVNIVAHDLKNPLTTIVGMSHFLQEDDFDQSTVRDSAKAISGSAEQMVDLITDFLNVEAMEQGKINLHKIPLSLSELTGFVVSTNKRLAEKKQQTVALTVCDSEKSMIVGDSERLYQSIENLFSNAIKYSPFGAPIEIRVERVENYARVSVKDTGAGLSEEDQKKLFGKFQKLAPRPTGNESSNGLGLSIVKLIVELHGGKVWAESALGRGSTFYIQLPLEIKNPQE